MYQGYDEGGKLFKRNWILVRNGIDSKGDIVLVVLTKQAYTDIQKIVVEVQGGPKEVAAKFEEEMKKVRKENKSILGIPYTELGSTNHYKLIYFPSHTVGNEALVTAWETVNGERRYFCANAVARGGRKYALTGKSFDDFPIEQM